MDVFSVALAIISRGSCHHVLLFAIASRSKAQRSRVVTKGNKGLSFGHCGLPYSHQKSQTKVSLFTDEIFRSSLRQLYLSVGFDFRVSGLSLPAPCPLGPPPPLKREKWGKGRDTVYHRSPLFANPVQEHDDYVCNLPENEYRFGPKCATPSVTRNLARSVSREGLHGSLSSLLIKKKFSRG